MASLEFFLDGGPVRPHIPLEDGGSLRIVSQYKHLGVWRRPSGGMSRELAHRGASAKAIVAALSRGFLSRSEVPRAERAAVARACVHSRGLYQAGAWPY